MCIQPFLPCTVPFHAEMEPLNEHSARQDTCREGVLGQKLPLHARIEALETLIEALDTDLEGSHTHIEASETMGEPGSIEGT